MPLNKRFLATGLIAAFALQATVVEGQGTRDDYQRVADFRAKYGKKVFRNNVRARWIKDQPMFWYQVSVAADKHEFVLVDAEKGKKESAFDHERLAEALTKASGQSVDPANLPFRSIRFDDDLSAIEFTAFGKTWRFDLQKHTVAELSDDEIDESTVRVLRRPQRSRDGGEETEVLFLNRTRDKVNLIWIDTGGGQHSYGTIEAGGQRRQHTYARHVWLITNQRGESITRFEAVTEPGTAVITPRAPLRDSKPRPVRGDSTSPDGRWTAKIQDHNVVVVDQESDEEFALSEDGTEEHPYLSAFTWSPDSQKLTVTQREAGQKRQVHMVESSPKEQLQPKLHSMTYAKPGDDLDTSAIRLFDVMKRKSITIDDELFPNPWRLSDVRWQPDSSRFMFLYNQRGHQVLRVIVVDSTTGEAAALIDESSETFVDYAGKRFLRYIKQTPEIVWMSERDGWNHLYLYDARTGEVKNQITEGNWVVRGVDRVDEDKRQIWFRAGGIFPEQDPYFIHHCRINFDGSQLVILTTGNGTHDIEYSPSGEYFLDTYSRVDLPPITELRRANDGSLVCEVERADASALLAEGWQMPERFVAKGRDGTTDIYGVIYRPSDLAAHADKTKHYPVIEKIYAGPHGSFVPKQFAVVRNEHAITELGFVVVQIDGMGTSHRSKAFHDVCWKNLGDSGFPDRIRWLQAAAKRYPYLDLDRVGIYGGSAGGQSSLRALLAHGDFYKVAVSDCGCHDNRMDKVWWNELWMGWPVGPHYEEQSNVTNAHKLTGKLLLTVGELDRNVDPASTMQVVDALIKADKDFEFLIVPGAGHGVGETTYAKRRRRDFFVRHLLGVEPREN